MAVRSQKGMTYGEYCRLPDDDGLRYELINGELYVTPAPNTRHQDVLGRLFLSIGNHIRERDLGRVFIAPYEVDFFDTDAVQPDLVFVSLADAGIITDTKILGVPTLVVEVLSSSSRDRRIKRNLYEKYRVPEYWIVDPAADQVEVYRLGVEGYAAPVILKPGDHLKTPLIPGTDVDLTYLFSK